MISTATRGLAVAAVVSSGCLLAGCGSSGSSTGSDAERHKPASTVLADAKSALFNAKAVHVEGTMQEDGQAEQIDLQLQGEDAAGTVTVAGSKVQVVNLAGKVYLKAPAAFWAKTGGAAAANLADKWISVTAAEAGATSQLTLQGIAASINADDSPLQSAVTTGTEAGQKVLILSQQDGSQLFVADSDTPLPIKLVGKGKTKGSVTFDAYGKTEKITAPAGAVSPEQAAKPASSPA